MNTEETNQRLSLLITLAMVVLVVAILRLAADVLIPIAIAVLLTFLLSPLVVRLMRWHLPKIAAIILTVTCAFSAIGVVGWIVTDQVISLAQALPDYETTIREKVQALKRPQVPPVLERAVQMTEKLRADISAPPPAPEPAEPESEVTPQPKPQPVEIHPPKPTALQLAREIISPVLEPLATAGIVIVVVVAMLFQREDLRDRLIKLCSAGKLNVATQVLDDAAHRVSRYLFMQLVVNATYGIPVGIGLYLIGIPNALLWGLLATLLRFIPFIGPWIAALFPVALAMAVDPGWTKLLYTIALFIVMEVVSNNIIEVRLYGAGTGISNVALLIAAVFWTWLWGPAGLFLSTPLTVCLLVLGKYVPGLKFLGVMLGSEPVLPPAAQLYQRMLSMDAEGMLELATQFTNERSATAFYDEVFIPALTMAEADRHAGTLAERRQKFIFQASRELIEDLERTSNGERDAGEEPAAGPVAAVQPTVVIVPATDDADEVAALMLQHLLRERGIEVSVTTVTTQPGEMRTLVTGERVAVVVVSAVPPAASMGTRRACRRLRHLGTRARLLAGIWNRNTSAEDLQAQLQRPYPERVVTQMADAVLWTARLAGVEMPATEPAAPTVPPPSPSRDAEVPLTPDSIVREVAQAFDVPVSLVNVVETDQAFWRRRSHHRPTGELDPRDTPDELLLRDHIVATDTVLVVEDVTKDRRFTSDPFLIERGIRFYACAPLRTRSGLTVGYLCVVDTRAREIGEDKTRLLGDRATALMAALEPPTLPDSPASGLSS